MHSEHPESCPRDRHRAIEPLWYRQPELRSLAFSPDEVRFWGGHLLFRESLSLPFDRQPYRFAPITDNYVTSFGGESDMTEK
jgi:hypothetical protein